MLLIFFSISNLLFSPDHPRIKEDGEAADTPLDNAVLNRLKQFRDMNKFKKAALRVSNLFITFSRTYKCLILVIAKNIRFSRANVHKVIAGSLSEEEIMGLKERCSEGRTPTTAGP